MVSCGHATTPHHLDGPAAVDSAEISVGQAVLGEEEDAMDHGSCAAEIEADSLPEPPSMADLPDLGLFCAASDLSSADTDVERAMRELAAKVEIVRDLASKSDNPEQVMRQVLELKDATKLINQEDFQKKLDGLLQEMAEAEGLPGDARQANGKSVIPSSKKPLSMY